MSERNPDLLAVSQKINKAMQDLQARADATDDPAEFAEINQSLQTLDQQLQRVNGLIFTARSQEIADAASEVEKAQGELSDAIRDAEQLNQVIASVTGLVGLVDTVIRTASRAAL